MVSKLFVIFVVVAIGVVASFAEVRTGFGKIGVHSFEENPEKEHGVHLSSVGKSIVSFVEDRAKVVYNEGKAVANGVEYVGEKLFGWIG
ncbi:unnamed protein product [Diamesa serratosioi]